MNVAGETFAKEGGGVNDGTLSEWLDEEDCSGDDDGDDDEAQKVMARSSLRLLVRLFCVDQLQMNLAVEFRHSLKENA